MRGRGDAHVSAGPFRDSGQRGPDPVALLLPAGKHPVLASWIRAVEQEAKPAWSQLFDCVAEAKALLPRP